MCTSLAAKRQHIDHKPNSLTNTAVRPTQVPSLRAYADRSRTTQNCRMRTLGERRRGGALAA
eukprot:scaffold6460_cov130-Isochrysis_galbana.AAC.13